MAMSFCLIVNPAAGRSSPWRNWANRWLRRQPRHYYQTASTAVSAVIDRLRYHGATIDIHYTTQSGDATRYAQLAAESGRYAAVIAMGGDGTINEVINGIIDTDVPLGVIPFGTANVYCSAFHLPNTINDAVDRIIAGKTTHIDVGSIHNRYFVCMAGIGFDAYIITRHSSSLKSYFGGFSYLITALRHYFSYPFHPISYCVDGRSTVHKCALFIISNTHLYGGRFALSPNASPSDGYLNACVFNDIRIMSILKNAKHLVCGQPQKMIGFKSFLCKEIEFKSGPSHTIHCDAEVIGHTPATAHIHSKKLRIIH